MTTSLVKSAKKKGASSKSPSRDYSTIKIAGGYVLFTVRSQASSWRRVSGELGGKVLAVVEKGTSHGIAESIRKAVGEAQVLIGTSESRKLSTSESEFVYLHSKDASIGSSQESEVCMMLFEA